MLAGMPNMIAEGLYRARIPHVGDNPAYLLLKDLFIAFVITGIAGSLVRRTVRKPDWLKNTPAAFVILLLILVVVTTEVLFHGSQFALGEGADFAGAAPLAYASSRLFAGMSEGALLTARALFWWIHFLAVFSLFFIIPRSKHLHMVFAPFNIYWRSLEPKGSLKKIRLEGENAKIYGAGKLEDFTWKQLFEAYACVKCGRCDGACPAHQSGEPVKPKRFNGRLRNHMEKVAPALLRRKAGKAAVQKDAVDSISYKTKKGVTKKNIIGDVYEEEFIWSCSTCGACLEACPVSVEHTARLFDLRRYIVSSGGNVPEKARQAMACVENCGNPWGISRQADCGLPGGLQAPVQAGVPGAQYLYFMGCAASFDETAGRAAAAFINILQKAGVSFAVLGRDEWCCGETVRRMGNEHLFQEIAKKNVSLFNRLNVRNILTTCSHCFNTLKNEYPQFGGRYQVTPHTVFLADLLREGKVKPNKSIDKTITCHDSCYLGRYNGFYSEQREILKSIPGVRLVEMPRSGKKSFCCGAGGGRFWMKSKTDNLIGRNRAKEAIATGAEVICTACPYCLAVLSEQVELEGSIKTLDIAEILEMSL
ncbi:MAG: (Fe-S)-binding protein [Pelotomaculum sp.]|nr:(Fe-S)-binding protein [Pelotomaculum sp.]